MNASPQPSLPTLSVPPSAICQRVLVIGAGTMGRGVARLFAGAGMDVTVLTRGAEREEGRIRHVQQPTDEVPDLVSENVPENGELKRAAFRLIEERYGGRPVLTTNTSGLPLQDLARELRYPERFLALHFFMPAELYPMIEVVRAPRTSDAAVAVALAAVATAGREPILLSRPIVGYVINRLQHALLHEAYHLLGSGVASAAILDRVAQRLIGPRLCVSGLLAHKDIAGLRIHADAQRSIVPALAHSGVPSPLLQELVGTGADGLRTGRGFYDWTGRDAAAVRADAVGRLRRLLAFLEQDAGDPPPELRPGAETWAASIRKDAPATSSIEETRTPR